VARDEEEQHVLVAIHALPHGAERAAQRDVRDERQIVA
jgi:hypothetical protein